MFLLVARSERIIDHSPATCSNIVSGLVIPSAFRLDLVVEDRLVVEVKSVEQLLRLHQSQLWGLYGILCVRSY